MTGIEPADSAFGGHVTLELSNVATLPIKLWPGVKIGQLCFILVTSAAEKDLRFCRVQLALAGPARADGISLVGTSTALTGRAIDPDDSQLD